MLEVGNVYCAELREMKIRFRVLFDNFYTYTINVTSVQGVKGIPLGPHYLDKFYGLIRSAKFSMVERLNVLDPKQLDDLIDLALDTKDEEWFFQLVEKKRKMEAFQR